ncbi:MAG: transporter [Leptolyngbya foveolarum]|uniref:Transporter n=1 Tax=Leptolyngbya foveolarum TaxID=47253 RepID=A0A2W4WFY0_9CYAN|nr:MAG: transporter [Leptolyngbya foveolarum]
MRYLKFTALLLLTISSSASVLSRSAIAQQVEGADSASLADEPIADQSPAVKAEEFAAGIYPTPLDLETLRRGIQRSASGDLLGTEQATSSQTGFQTNTAADTTEIAVADRTAATNRTEQIAQAEDLPVLEEGTPATTAAPGDPVPSDPGSLDLLPNSGIQSGPDVVQPIPDDAPVQGAEPELGDLPDILFADPNPLNLPTTLEGVEIERNPLVTLEQAIELAYRNSQTLQATVLQLEQAEAAVDQARAANLPSLSTSAGITSQQRDAVDGGLNPFTGQQLQGQDAGLNTALNGGLRVDYDLLTGGRRAANIRQAELQRQVAALSVESQQEQIRLITANNYYQLQEAGEQIRIQRTFLEEAERNLRDSRLRQEVGVGTRFDTLRAEVQYANARQQVIQAQGSQRIARRDIARLLNLPPNAGLQTSPVSVAENWPLTLEESILLAFDNRAELEQQLLQADISEQQRQIALSAVRPQVGLFADYSLQSLLNDGADDIRDNYSFGASFNMVLFDGGAARASARQQEIGSQIAEEQFSENADQIRFDVEQAYFNLDTNQENIATSRIAVSQAEEALELANLRLQAGVGTQLDVLTAQSELTTAQGNNITAILNYNRALAAMQRAVSNVTVE